MHAVVRCPHCDGLSRVPPEALGRTVGCPRCDRPFPAAPEPPAAPAPIPVVHPVGRSADPGHDPSPHGPASALVGLALLPLGIPLVWTAVLLLSGVEPVFSLALPVAIGLGVAGVCLGVVAAADWTHATRVKGILMLVLLGYGSAAFLYFVQKDWLEAARRRVGGRAERWHEFRPPDDPGFTVRTPGKAEPDPAADPLPGWTLRSFRSADRKQQSTDVYWIAYGPPPEELAAAADDAWFAAVRKAVTAAAGGEEPAEEAIGYRQAGGREHPGREYRVVLPDRITNRTVRVYRVGRRVVYLAAEGAALPADAPDVKNFFRTFVLKSKTGE